MTRKDRRALARKEKSRAATPDDLCATMGQRLGVPAEQLAADLAKADYTSPARGGLAVIGRSYDERGELVSGG